LVLVPNSDDHVSASSSETIISHPKMALSIREVWAPNLESEMQIIREVMEEYPYIAMVRPPEPPRQYDWLLNCGGV
jgi:hypothetical protein